MYTAALIIIFIMIEVFRLLLKTYEKIDIPVEYVVITLIFALSLILDKIMSEVRKLRG
jgi:division protein CdvB (Snf7/Vps24/ESCRT-III family)